MTEPQSKHIVTSDMFKAADCSEKYREPPASEAIYCYGKAFEHEMYARTVTWA